MEILPYQPEMSSELASAYNNVIHRVPHCYPIDADEFAAVVDPVAEGGKSHDHLHSEAAFVARKGPVAVGFIHVGLAQAFRETGTDEGIIRFFWYEPGHRQAGRELLAAAEDRLRQHDTEYVQAFPQEFRYPFYYLGPAYLSDRLGHIVALLAFHGYKRSRGEVFLDWPDFQPPVPTPAQVPAEISVHWREGRGTRPAVTVQASHDNEEIGVCECGSCGKYSRAPEAQDWLMTESLSVIDEMQGRGLGRFLLQRALREMRGVGYRHAAISTALDNHRALLFYSNCGYHVVDWTYSFTRRLKRQ